MKCNYLGCAAAATARVIPQYGRGVLLRCDVHLPVCLDALSPFENKGTRGARVERL